MRPTTQHLRLPAWRQGVHVGKVSLVAVSAMLDAMPGSWDLVWDLKLRGKSKFEDPWVSQGRMAEWGIPPGRAYLDGLPMSGAVRVDAMLSKIAGPDGDRIIPMETELRAVGEILRQRIDADALKLRESVWRGWDYMLEKTGASSNIYAIAIIEGMKWLTTQFDISNFGASAKAKAMASGAIETALSQMAVSMDSGVPYPWHAFEVTPLDIRKLRDTITKTKDSQADFSKGISEVVEEAGHSEEAISLLDAAARSLTCNNQRWFGNRTHTGAPLSEGKMPTDVRDVAIGWWSMLLAGLSNAQVVRAFHAMHGDNWGGNNLASDEQVMIVAAAVSNAYGVPLRELAIELWERSPGWSGDPALLSQVGCVGLGDYGKTPTNATQVQWWQLARNAISIASAMKAGKPIPMLKPYTNAASARPIGSKISLVEVQKMLDRESSIGGALQRSAAAVVSNIRAHKLPYTVVALGAAVALSLTIARAWMRP